MRDVEIAKHFVKATTNILSTMAGIVAAPGMPYVKKDQIACGDISAIIGVTGPRNGTISVSFSAASATAQPQNVKPHWGSPDWRAMVAGIMMARPMPHITPERA